MSRRLHVDGTLPESGEVFVFGSNLDGAHYGGAARVAAEQFQATYGLAEGASGRAYAIPTMDFSALDALPLEAIAASVREFVDYAQQNPSEAFFVTRVGCGIAGHSDADIAPMFSTAPANCSLPDRWEQFL